MIKSPLYLEQDANISIQTIHISICSVYVTIYIQITNLYKTVFSLLLNVNTTMENSLLWEFLQSGVTSFIVTV